MSGSSAATSTDSAAPNGHTTRREETRRRLLEAGTAAFAEIGLHGITTARIARRAGVGTGTFYLHFPDKHALFEEIVFAALAELRARQDRAAAERAPGTDELRARTEELISFTEEKRDLIRVVFSRGSESAAIAQEIHDRVASGVEAWLTHLVKQQKLPIHPGAAAQARAATLIRVIAWWAEDPTRATRQEIVDTLLHLQPGRLASGATN
jgi:AcrR family transcriptional regulator